MHVLDSFQALSLQFNLSFLKGNIVTYLPPSLHHPPEKNVSFVKCFFFIYWDNHMVFIFQFVNVVYYNRQRINLKNIQVTPAAQFQKNKWPNQEMGQRSKQTFLQRRHTDGWQIHEKMLNITHYQRNVNQNHNEVPLHASQDGCYPKVYKQ